MTNYNISEVEENNENPTKVKDNPPENLNELNQKFKCF